MNEVPDQTGAADPENTAGPAKAEPESAAAAANEWEVVHSGSVDSASTPAARALMRTSDGEFRITASHVDGKVGLTIELRRSAAAAPRAVEEEHDEDEDLSPLIRRVLGLHSVPGQRRANLSAHDEYDKHENGKHEYDNDDFDDLDGFRKLGNLDGREDRGSEAA